MFWDKPVGKIPGKQWHFAMEEARKQGIKHIVVASNTGETVKNFGT